VRLVAVERLHIVTARLFRPAFVALSSLAMVLVLSACTPAPAAVPTAVPAVSLKVVLLPFISFTPLYLGVEDGFFEEQNLHIELVDMTTQLETTPALLSGQVDVTSGNLASGTFNTVARGGQLKIVADKGHIASSGGCADFSVLARNNVVPAGGVTAAVLRGRKLAVVPGSWQAYYADRALVEIGLKLEDLETINTPAAQVIEALASGQVDMSAIAEPWVTRIANNGNQPVLGPVQRLIPEAQYSTLIFGSKLLGPNGDVGNRFMLAFLKAVRRYNAEGRSDRVVQIVSKYTKLDVATLQSICWPSFRGDGALNIPSMIDFQKWAVAHGLIETPVTPEQFSDPSFLKYANDRLGPAPR
jgi:ABC-type nitrate/sulfonate/bicarbonate transport system substrate-binding protein